MNLKKKYISKVRDYLFWILIILSVALGIIFYKVFLSYYPGINWSEFFITKLKINFFEFSGIVASIFVSLPIIIIAFEIFFRNSTSYITGKSEKTSLYFSEDAIKTFVENVVFTFNGIENVLVKVEIFKKNYLGLHIYIELSEKTDFVKFSERISERVRQDLEFNFGITEIRFLNIYIENLSHTNEQNYIVIYK
ncbi:MAG: alkaline shock response membrane anchor protein AmaP [Brevinematales bacterium]|nr:alkaline shock response membrane anchor protein AmaP [Brevinematales bacterium]